MKKIIPYQIREDARGKLIGLMNEGTWEEFNYLETKAGHMRGNHYHKHTRELFFIIEGEVDIEIIQPNGIIVNDNVTSGDIILIEPYENHTFYCVTETKWINALTKRFEQGSPDIHAV
jgi:mannose-6-phosphate isomerase-like protein (cupin superfamily)